MIAEEVLYHVTGNTQLINTDVDAISAIVKQYPYFSPAQFLLTLKQKKDNSYNYQYQLQKTSLYFSNQAWLNYILNEKEVSVPDLYLHDAEPIVEVPNHKVEENIFPTSLLGSHSHSHNDIIENEEDQLASHNNDATKSGEAIADTAVESPFDYSSLFTNSSDIEIPTLEAVRQLLDNKSAEAGEEKTSVKLPSFPSILKEPIATTVVPSTPTSRIPSFSFTPTKETEAVHEEKAPSIFVSKPTASIANDAIEETKLITDEPEAVENKLTHTKVEHPDLDTTTSIPSYSFKGFAEEAVSSLTDAVSLSEAFANNHHENEQEDSEEHNEHEHESESYNTNNNISLVLSSQLEGFHKPIEENSKFEFENESKLHTIDYFASQGIKIDLTKQPQDKLTVQMRRFTDWLKQIKKTDSNPQDLGTDPELEKAIQNIAKTSIEAKEIVTETMADVFIKQGKVSKAIQLYIKLSFLDPSKSTYFATKIQQLKGI